MVDARHAEDMSVESKHKHLEFIQGVIARMGSNSFRLKGWCVALVAALVLLAVREGKGELAIIGLFPVLVLWGLDAYYLRQERRYVVLYDYVRQLPPGGIDFSMKVGDRRCWKLRWFGALLSITLIAFYTAAAITVTVVAITAN